MRSNHPSIRQLAISLLIDGWRCIDYATVLLAISRDRPNVEQVSMLLDAVPRRRQDVNRRLMTTYFGRCIRQARRQDLSEANEQSLNHAIGYLLFDVSEWRQERQVLVFSRVNRRLANAASSRLTVEALRDQCKQEAFPNAC